MKHNVGKIDKAIRLLLFTLFVVFALMYSYWWLIAAGIILLTVVTGFCGPYAAFGICTCETCKTKKKRTKKKK